MNTALLTLYSCWSVMMSELRHVHTELALQVMPCHNVNGRPSILHIRAREFKTSQTTVPSKTMHLCYHELCLEVNAIDLSCHRSLGACYIMQESENSHKKLKKVGTPSQSEHSGLGLKSKEEVVLFYKYSHMFVMTCSLLPWIKCLIT